MHHEAHEYVKRVVSSIRPRRRVVEIGSRNVNGSVRDLFLHVDRYIGIDRMPGPGVDMVADGSLWQPDLPVDCVVTTEALEHCEMAEAIVVNAWSMLEPRGVLIVTAATDPRPPHSAYDGGPLRQGEFYRNVARSELLGWLVDFYFASVEIEGGDIRALAVK